jgi:hypothetical protein
MADPSNHLDARTLRELEDARQQHLQALRRIPLRDRHLFIESCQRHEQRVELILRAAAERRSANGNGAADSNSDAPQSSP